MNTINALLNQARTLHNAGDVQGAFNAYQQVIGQSPNNTEALNGLGVLALQIGNAELAESFLLRAVKKEKREAKYWNNLGLAQRRLGKHKEAIQSHNKAIKLNKQYVEAMNNLAALYIDIGRYDDAIPLLKRALRIKPDYANAHGNLGVALNKTERHKEATISLQRALQYDPNNPNTYVSLATTWKDLGELSKAVSYANEAISQGAGGIHKLNALNILGLVYMAWNEFTDAHQYFAQALEIDPNSTDVHINKGLCALKQGDLASGWDDYIWRMKMRNVQLHLQQFPQPTWQKEPLTGKSITVLAEQGLGDEITFANMFPDVIAEADECIIECDPRLQSLYSRSFQDATFVERKLPPSKELINSHTDFKATASQLAWRYRTSLDMFPSKKGYLTASPERTAYWREQLLKLSDQPVIGICWRSSLITTNRSTVYTSLTEWKDILTTPDVTFINLQYDDCSKELSQVKESVGVTIHNMEVDLMNDLDEAAALTSALDYVISAPTAVAAMAGALGKETLVITKRNWTMLGTDHYPWYPNVQITPYEQGESISELLRHAVTIVRQWANG